MSTISFDSHYIFLGAVVTVGMQLLFFFVAFGFKFDKVTDFAGGMNFSLLALLTFFLQAQNANRQIVITVLVVVSRTWLGMYLLYRVLSRGKDSRFDEVRESCGKFFGFWIFQMIWVFGVSLPVLFVNGDSIQPSLEIRDYVGIAMFVVGFVIQLISDLQKNAFRGDKKNSNRVCDVGLWHISRHPNYFGEILLWWGIFVGCTPVFDASASNWGYATVVSPVLTMIILLFLSGIPSAEGPAQARFMKSDEDAKNFLIYRNRTSILIPFPPFLYACLPRMIKVIFFFEYPMYEYTPTTEKETRLVATI